MQLGMVGHCWAIPFGGGGGFGAGWCVARLPLVIMKIPVYALLFWGGRWADETVSILARPTFYRGLGLCPGPDWAWGSGQQSCGRLDPKE